MVEVAGGEVVDVNEELVVASDGVVGDEVVIGDIVDMVTTVSCQL